MLLVDGPVDHPSKNMNSGEEDDAMHPQPLSVKANGAALEVWPVHGRFYID